MKLTDIAPCGMNCALCLAYKRKKNPCSGCRSTDGTLPEYCQKCVIANCEKMEAEGRKYCYGCNTYPCKRLKALDKRYRTKYGMSMLENLENIGTKGIRQYVRDEKVRWACTACGKTLCVHRPVCPHCGDVRTIRQIS